jgi:plastocyanin
MKLNPRFLIVPALMACLQAVTAGDLTGTVTLSGTPPEAKVNDALAGNPQCSALHSEPVKLVFYKVGPNKGLADVVIKITNINAKSTGESAPPLVLDQKGCEYIPYVAAVQTGQKVLIKSSDPFLHNVHISPAEDGGNASKAKNAAEMGGGPPISVTFPAPEDLLTIKCDVHPWMFSYITVVDHPYFAVSGEDGKYKIANVPPGKYTVEARHRKANRKNPVVKEIEVKPDGAVLDFTIEVPKADAPK